MNTIIDWTSSLVTENIPVTSLFTLVALAVGIQTIAGNKERRLPPGPPKDPLIGNLRNFPKKNFVKTFCDWKELYGDVVHSQVFGQNYLVLNSREAIQDVMIEHAPRNTDRPTLVMSGDLCGWAWSPVQKSAGPKLLQERKIILSTFGPSHVKNWYPIIERSTNDLMCHFSENGEPDIQYSIRSYLAKIVLQIAYGEKIYETHREELLDANKAALSQINYLRSNFWLVDVLPFLRYLPKWLPGTNFLKIAEESRKISDKILQWSFNLVLEEKKNNSTYPSVALQALEDGVELDRVREAVGVLYMAGLDTTYMSLATFVQAMLYYPDVQRKGQQEIDEFLKTEGRLPGLEDRQKLSYLDALIKEVLRWNPPVPLGIPHINQEEDEYRGMKIPKNSTIFPNIWLAMHDKETWNHPEQFKPERFLEDLNHDLPDPAQWVFGFGRRLCPGKNLADRILYLCIVHTLGLFTIELAPGEILPPKPVVSTSFFAYPQPPKSKFVLRNPEMLVL